MTWSGQIEIPTSALKVDHEWLHRMMKLIGRWCSPDHKCLVFYSPHLCSSTFTLKSNAFLMIMEVTIKIKLLLIWLVMCILWNMLFNYSWDVWVLMNNYLFLDGLLVIHLPEGPTALFRISNPKLCKDIHRDYNEITAHRYAYVP